MIIVIKHIIGEAIEIIDLILDIKKGIKYKRVLYYDKNNVLNSIEGKIVIEGLGHYNTIGVKYSWNFKKYKQVFVGYEIELTRKLCNLNKAIIMDWYKVILVGKFNNNIPSFSYIFPTTDTSLFIEETILVKDEDEFDNNKYKILELRLLQRLYMYSIKDYKILRIEKNCISMNRYIRIFIIQNLLVLV